MPLMCCDACSEIDFKPINLGLSCTCFCPSCKQVSTHTFIAQSYRAVVKKINSDELIFKSNDDLTFELNNGCLSKPKLAVMGQSKSKLEGVLLRFV